MGSAAGPAGGPGGGHRRGSHPTEASTRYRIDPGASILIALPGTSAVPPRVVDGSCAATASGERVGAVQETITTSSSTSHIGPGRVASGLRFDAILTRLPVTPVVAGLAVAIGLVVAFVLLVYWSGSAESALAGDAGLWTYRDFRIAILVAMLAGYLPVARHEQARSAMRNRRDLQPCLADGAPDVATFGRLDVRSARLAGLAGIAFAPLTALVIDRDPALYLTPGYWRVESVFGWVVGGWVGFWIGSFFYVTLAYARRFSRLADRLRDIDLLDLGALRPFARHGLASALQWLVLLSVVALNAMDVGWFVMTAAVAVVGGVAALILPVQGLHVRLRDAKQAELDRVRVAIGGDASALAGSPLGRRAETLSLADLLAWNAFVESIREWPFDAFTIVRFAIYLVIPLGSWLGGAFVERLLGAALD